MEESTENSGLDLVFTRASRQAQPSEGTLHHPAAIVNTRKPRGLSSSPWRSRRLQTLLSIWLRSGAVRTDARAALIGTPWFRYRLHVSPSGLLPVVFVRCCVIRRQTRPACERILQPRLFYASSNSQNTPYGYSFSETKVDSVCASFYLKGILLFAGRVRYAYVARVSILSYRGPVQQY